MTLQGDGVSTHVYNQIFTIDGVEYKFRFRYSSVMLRWIFNITHPNGDAVVTGAPVVYGVNLFSYADPALRPRGVVTCIWKSNETSAPEPTEFELGKTSVLLYYERIEDFDFSDPVEPGQS